MTETPKTLIAGETALRESPAPDLGGMDGHFLTFRIGDRQLAFPLEKVKRVIRMAALVAVPEAPEWVSGLLNLHGRVIPVISLRERLGLPHKGFHPDHRILVVQTGRRTMGVIAETVEQVVTVSGDHLAKPEGTLKDSPLLNAIFRNNDEVYLVLESDEIDTGALLDFTESE